MLKGPELDEQAFEALVKQDDERVFWRFGFMSQ